MRGLVLVAGLVLSSVAAAVASQSGGEPTPSSFPPPVDILGVRIELRTVSATINVQSAEQGGVSTTRSITVNGVATPLARIEGAAPASERDGDFVGTTSVMWAELMSLVGDDREIALESTRQRHLGSVAQRRQRLSQVLLNNPHALLQPPPHLSPQQIHIMQMTSGGFTAHAKMDTQPARIDRMVVGLDIVRAAKMDIISMPLEAMTEHREIVPGVRFLVRSVEDTESNGRTYTRVGLEYFIERDQPERDADDPDAFETTPLVPAIAIRDANGQIVHLLQRAQETETRDEFIVSIGDLNLGVSPQVKRPLTIDVVVLHGLERHKVEMVVEDLALAGE